jgi:hypothetical protein
MYLFVSWCYVSTAESVANEFSQQKESDILEKVVPEYVEYLKAKPSDGATKKKKAPAFDRDSSVEELLAIRFVDVENSGVFNFKLSQRMDSSGKLPVALAAKNWLTSRFPGEWEKDAASPRRNARSPVFLVGLPGLKAFLHEWALSCAVYGSPLPYHLWKTESLIELAEPSDILKVMKTRLLKAPDLLLEQDVDNFSKYHKTTGASAERDASLLYGGASLLLAKPDPKVVPQIPE